MPCCSVTSVSCSLHRTCSFDGLAQVPCRSTYSTSQQSVHHRVQALIGLLKATSPAVPRAACAWLQALCVAGPTRLALVRAGTLAAAVTLARCAPIATAPAAFALVATLARGETGGIATLQDGAAEVVAAALAAATAHA